MNSLSRLFAGAAVIAAAVLPPAAAADAPARPNVVVVMTDDQGLGDFSFTGNPVLKTPHLDRFARQAVRLTDFHVAPMCSPTRGQLLTGVDACRNGVTSVTAGRTFLRPGYPTAAEIFGKAGYQCGIFGKWHLGDHYPHRPTDRGFHAAVTHHGWGYLNSTPEAGNPLIDGTYLDGTTRKPFKGHCTDLWFDAATGWMAERKAAGEPFFCYIPTNAPHGPHQELPQYIEPYRGKKGPANFFGMIAHVDERFGKLDRFLTDSGLRDNTIVVFLTDNGGTSGVPLFNAGLRAGKTTYYDGGHRVPCWVRWPAGNLGDPRDVPTPTQVQDLLPTLVEFCGVPAAGAKFDGTSLAGLLRGNADALPARAFVVQYSRDKLQKWDSCVVRGDWRLVKGEELYDVAKDRGQKENVAATHPDVVKRLRADYEAWWAGLGSAVDEYQPCATVGAEAQPAVPLTSGDWEGIYADNTGHVRRAEGGPRGGRWHLTAAAAGDYAVTLRRWWPAAKTPLGGGYNEPPDLAALVGKNYDSPAKTFPGIAAGLVAVGGGDPASATADPKAESVTVRVTLPAGRTTLQAWFRDADGNDLCGAYFAEVRKLP